MHLCYFSPSTITQLLEAAGFKVLSISRHKRVTSIRYLLQKIACYSSLAEACLGIPVKLLGIGDKQLTANFGDIMDVYAEKPAMNDPQRHNNAT